MVVGSLNLDRVAVVDRHPAPGETTIAVDSHVGLGGKGANQALAAARESAVRTVFVGAVGDDDAGDRARAAMARAGVDTSRMAVAEGVPSGTAHITVDGHGENSIVVIAGANRHVGADALATAFARLEGADAVLAQGELHPSAVEAAARWSLDHDTRFILNLAPVVDVADRTILAADPLVLNEGEAMSLAGRLGAGSDSDDPGARAAALHALTHHAVVITLGPDGAVVVDGAGVQSVPSPTPERVIDTTGAGDAFTGALAARLALGDGLVAAVTSGCAAGAAAVATLGANQAGFS